MLTQSYLKSILTYDPITGLLTWNKSGKVAGGVKCQSGYWFVRINNKDYRAHRLAWLYTYGRWPTIVDHRNRVKTANWLSNLREVTNTENVYNSDRFDRHWEAIAGAGTTQGSDTHDGVYYRRDRNKYRARTWVRTSEGKRKRVSIGHYFTEAEAVKAYNDYVSKHKS